ncbi:unnamed protein product [Bemisia tabaci]|uniref:Serine/threonine-protein phosphatase n=1 Tax=Bemisia tabaci TaxID=7038 RepID=A0A9N9ZZC6_BEMTA|nr:unnamed protein product [Bemisia tabaci]
MSGAEKLKIRQQLGTHLRSTEKLSFMKRLFLKLCYLCLIFVYVCLCAVAAESSHESGAAHVDNLTLREQNFGQTGNEEQETEVADSSKRWAEVNVEKAENYLSLDGHDESLRGTVVERKQNQPIGVSVETKPKHEFSLKKTVPVGRIQDDSYSVDYDAINVGPDYNGPRLKDGIVSLKFMRDLVQHFRVKKRLHSKYAYQIIRKIRNFYRRQPSLLEIKVPKGENITICGDIHGQLYDLLNIFEMNGWPSETNRYLFNGDFINRGRYGVECALLLFGFKLLYPKRFFLNRGNHESKMMSHYFGFDDEVKFKYSQKMLDMFGKAFRWLPLAHRIDKKILVVHAGLFSEDGVTISDIKHIERNCEPIHSPLMFDMLWSDPKSTDGRSPNFMRGAGIEFGPDVTRSFCRRNQVEYIIRSHYPPKEGHRTDHNNRIVTVFSAPNDQAGNKGAILKLTAPKFEPQFVTFTQMPEWDMDHGEGVESDHPINDSQQIKDTARSMKGKPSPVSATSKYFP